MLKIMFCRAYHTSPCVQMLNRNVFAVLSHTTWQIVQCLFSSLNTFRNSYLLVRTQRCPIICSKSIMPKIYSFILKFIIHYPKLANFKRSSSVILKHYFSVNNNFKMFPFHVKQPYCIK